MKLVVAISGASGVELGLKFVELLPKDVKTYLIISKGAKKAFSLESKKSIKKYKYITVFEDEDLSAPIASGSFEVDKYIIVPCSMNTLAKCTVGISDTLITRVFSVMLKERRDIVIAPREMPYNTIQLENMSKLSSLGVTVAPPVLGYYSEQQTLDEMEKFIVGKWYDLLKIKHKLFKRWGN